MSDPITEFRLAMARAGIDYSGQIHGDGKRYRIPVGPKDTKKSASYILHLDDRPAGMLWNFRTSEDGISWKADSGMPALTPAERSVMAAKAERARQEKAREVERSQADAAKRASKIWGIAKPCEMHPYLERKQVPSYGLRTDNYWRYVDGRSIKIPQALFVPMYSGPRQIASLQAIFPDGNNPLGRDRDFLPGGRKEGCYFRIGRPSGTVIICEGYSTGASIHLATGYCVMVAMTRGNLMAVARMVRTALPGVDIVLAADDDRWTAGNPGIRDATEAARAVKGRIAVPEFGDINERLTDFNDLMILHGALGLEIVKGNIERACTI